MLGLKEYIWQKRRFLKKDMTELKEILILVMFVNIKEAHPKERNLKGGKMSRDTSKYKYKKKGDINRRNRKRKREKEKTNSGKKNYA